MPLTLKLLNDTFCIHRFQAGAEIPAEALQADFFSITRTDDELSLVLPSSIHLESDKSEPDWSCLKVLGPLDFALTGILAGIADVLAKAKVSIFAISTFDTDYILVNSANERKTIDTLRACDYTVITGAGE